MDSLNIHSLIHNRMALHMFVTNCDLVTNFLFELAKTSLMSYDVSMFPLVFVLELV